MPPRRRKATNDTTTPAYTWSYRVTLSCGHNRLHVPPLPALGVTVFCQPCNDDAMVVAIDRRELEVYCTRHGVVQRFHIMANISAGCLAAKHNVTENKGRCHAIIREAGTVERYDPATDMRSPLRDERQDNGTLF